MALKYAKKAGERLYEMNVLISIALLYEQASQYKMALETMKTA